MNKPNLNNTYETFIRIGLLGNVNYQELFQILKEKLSPAIRHLTEDGLIDWFSFLIHDRKSGNIPTDPNDENIYFHIRLSVSENRHFDSLRARLPDYCLMTRKVKVEDVRSISVTKTTQFDTSLHRQECIEEIWRLLGGQSEFILNVFNSYKDGVTIPVSEIREFLHLFYNMVGISSIQCPNCKAIINI